MNIANQSFPSFRSDLNNALSAIQTTHSGTSRPTGAVAGQIWLDTTSATSPTLKYYDGADDISLATIDHVANTVNWLDSTVSVTGLTTTATGTVLTLSDTANTTSVNLIIDNQKEIRFRETTANGTNYIGLKAPASVTADLTFTLPSTDGTSGQFLKTDGAGNLSFSSSLPTTSFTGATAETSIADADLVLIYDDSATAVRKMTKSNFVAGIGGSNTPAFVAKPSTTQSITANTWTKVDFGTEIVDSNNNFASSRFTPTTAGYYFIYSSVDQGTTNTYFYLNIYKNGSGFVSNTVVASQAGGMDVQTIMYFNGSTDYVEVYTYQGSSTGSVSSNTQGSTFGGFRLIGV